MRLHFTALGDTGWGEVTLGLRIARDAVQAGHEAVFTVPRRLVGHVRTAGFEAHADPGGVRDAVLPALDAQCPNADARVLVDLNLTGAALFQRQVHPDTLLADRPVVGIDTWTFAELLEAGVAIDLGPGVEVPVERVWGELPNRIVPVPFARPNARHACDLLPRTPRVDGRIREQRRKALGLDGPAVLLCSSGWQHRLLAQMQGSHTGPVLELVALYLARLGDDVRVLHVGPEDLPWPSAFETRVQRLAPMDVADFEATVAAVDAVLSLNASATTNTTALHLGTPVLTLWNAWSAGGAELAFKLGYRPSSELRSWVRSHAPVSRFAMWPMGWQRVLATLLADNPYADRLHLTDLLDEQSVHDTLSGFLRDDGRRDIEAAEQARYVERVRALPSPASMLAGFLEGRT